MATSPREREGWSKTAYVGLGAGGALVLLWLLRRKGGSKGRGRVRVVVHGSECTVTEGGRSSTGPCSAVTFDPSTPKRVDVEATYGQHGAVADLISRAKAAGWNVAVENA